MRHPTRVILYIDRPVFKLFGAVLSVILFILMYYLLVSVSRLGLDSTVGAVFPALMVLLWEMLKRRYLWLLWLAAPLGALAVSLLLPSVPNLPEYCYWAMSLGVCCLQAFSDSKRTVRFRERDRETANMVPDQMIPQKDEFLETLFADKK